MGSRRKIPVGALWGLYGDLRILHSLVIPKRETVLEGHEARPSTPLGRAPGGSLAGTRPGLSFFLLDFAGLRINVLCQLSQFIVRLLFFFQGLFQERDMLVFTEQLGKSPDRAITGDFIVLDALGCANNGGIHHCVLVIL